MSTKVSSRARKQRQKEDMKQEIVVQVHKPTIPDPIIDKENINHENTNEDSSESNRTYKVEDKNDNYSIHTPSRDISVDEDTQINSKILNLIETEMKRDINKHSHFTDSRPQSLSFYEDEKIPEELSGNLELLSPEERKHYKRRKEYSQMDTDERNAYNAIQDLYSRDNDEIITSTKKSKSRKKRHGDSEHGMGDSREMMIPKEKRKSKKKKHENSPSTANSKRKHRKRDEEHEPRNEITAALEELQDDVFENNVEEFGRNERIKKSPRKSDKLYVQRKNKFEVTNRQNSHCRNNMVNESDDYGKRLEEYKPIELAVKVQKFWLPFTTLCHGLLGGLSLAHFVYLRMNYWSPDNGYIVHYACYSDFYTCMFYFLCIICIVSVFDRYDLAHIDFSHLKDMLKCKKSSVVILLYIICLLLHLSATSVEDKISLIAYSNLTVSEITTSEIHYWNNMSFARGFIAFFAWIIISLAPSDDMLYIHLKNMEKYIVNCEN